MEPMELAALLGEQAKPGWWPVVALLVVAEHHPHSLHLLLLLLPLLRPHHLHHLHQHQPAE